MNTIHWFEVKQLDRVTNYSSRTECVKSILEAGGSIYYYCTFAKKRVYYGLQGNIVYLGMFKNKVFKFLEFQILVMLKSLQIVLSKDRDAIIVNQDLVHLMKPCVWINKLLKKHNKFILDVRTLPTDTVGFEQSMNKYYKQMADAVRLFDGLSFITPYMEKVSLKPFHCELPTVNWSSGVNIQLFDASQYDYTRDNDTFRIFYHGGISESRGNLDLIKACALVKERGYNIELVQIGKIVDTFLQEYIKNNHYESWCHLYDAKPLNQIPAWVAKCDLPLLPFPDYLPWRVSSPIKLMEYMAMGKPVLVPNMECFTDILSEESGLVYYYSLKADNVVEEMANAIIRRVKNTPIETTYVKSPVCINFVSERFTWKHQAEKLMQFCLNLCR